MTRVAIAHDFLGVRAGGERVALALAETFAGAPIHTLTYAPSKTFAQLAEHQIIPSWMNRSALLRARYRSALPLAAPTFFARRIDADVVICSTSGLSHHVRCTGRKVIYCHTPARWLHDPDAYLDGFPAPVQSLARLVAPAYRRLDQAAMRSADQIVVNSEQIRSEVRAIYGRDSVVVAPTSPLDASGPQQPIAGLQPGFVLSVTRPLAYKRLELLVQAARALPDEQFVLIGDGPNRAEIESAMPPNMMSLGALSDERLRWAYANARLVALTCAEDFGLVPVEAAAFGLESVVPDARGFVDPDRDLLLRYEPYSVPGLVAAIKTGLARSSVSTVRPIESDRERFGAQMRKIVLQENETVRAYG